MKKIIALISFMCIFLLAACQSDSTQPESKKKSGDHKIASMSIHLTNDLLALGVTPAGSVVGGELKDFLPHVKNQLKDTKKLGPASDPDMEALLELNPDNIYLDKEFAGKDVSKYKKIGNTHVFDLDKGTWRDHLKDIGKIVKREKEAKTFIQDYEDETKQVKSMINKELGKNAKVMAIRVNAKELRVFSTRRPMGPILFDDLKLKPADGIKEMNTSRPYEVISQEVLPDYNADAIFVVVNRDDKSQQAYKELQKSAVWKGLKAVKANHVYKIADQPWLDYSALGNKLAMDEAKKMFQK